MPRNAIEDTIKIRALIRTTLPGDEESLIGVIRLLMTDAYDEGFREGWDGHKKAATKPETHA